MSPAVSDSRFAMLHAALYARGLRLGALKPVERVYAMMVGPHGDVVPFMPLQYHDHAMFVARVPARKYYWDAELLVSVQLAVARWYGFDCDNIVADFYNPEIEALGARMIYSDNAMPTVDSTQPLIRERADLDRLESLDASRGRIPVAVELARLASLRGRGPFVGGVFCGVFSFICQAMGYARAVRALRRDRVFAQELFDYAENQAIFPYLRAMAAAGVKNLNGSDAWAAFPNLTLEMIEEWIVPSTRRLAERGKKELHATVREGLVAADYCEEDPAKFDKALMWRCFDLGQQILGQPAVFAAMGRTQDWDMRWLQEYGLRHRWMGGRVPLVVSLNGRFLRDSTPEGLVAKVREWLDILARDGRLLLAAGNIPADTPPANVHTVVQAIHTLGRYPLARDLAAVPLDPVRFEPFDEWLKGQPEADVVLKAREG